MEEISKMYVQLYKFHVELIYIFSYDQQYIKSNKLCYISMVLLTKNLYFHVKNVNNIIKSHTA